MSVKIYPYLTDPSSLIPETASDVVKSTDTLDEDSAASFQQIFAQADRSLQAMAVDALIAQSETGSVDIATVQKLFGFSPSPVPIAANSALSSEAAAEKADGGVSSNAGASTGCTPELDMYFAEAAAQYQVDVNLLKAIAKAESGFNPSATSGAGAMGIMQLMPSTASSLGIADAYNARDNIMGGAKLIAEYIERYEGNLSLALAAYNAGPGNVDKYSGVPPFEETQNYVKKVLDYYENA